ncbi:LuxR C-terminal-related transcriptional regulator [Actinoallomurus sp. NPDC052274]|uniref:ATP-binding protein n=1 Tax=Actinoallomurus sp. NPDC052274 TaxID=3155420 RepID=UPI0034389F9B
MVTGTISGRDRVHGLPAERTSFVGRRREVAEVKRILADARVVTLTGPGGVGKTRLASRVALTVGRAFPDGVWLVDLAALQSQGMLARAVIEALGIRDRSARAALDVLAEHLRNKRALLILDNCEHVVDECAAVTRTVQLSAPDLRILATSRQSLSVPGEQLLEVPPLAMPGSTGAGDRGRSLERFEAVRLFAERGADVSPGFAVTDANGDAVVEICRRLDGIPLAIELAAAQLRILSLDRLLVDLEDRFELLTGSGRPLPRHRTLRALIDWSYDLCTAEERLLWARLSIFAGSFDLEAAETVCSGEGIARQEVVDLVGGMVDKSILIPQRHDEVVRYRLLETIRQYGRQKLDESGRSAALRRRHRDHYRRLAGQTRARVAGPDQRSWLLRLGTEHPNLRVALESCYTEPGQARTGLAMAADLMYHWISGVFLGEGRAWLERGLAAEPGPSDVRAHALWTSSVLAVIQGDAPAAETMLRECRSLGDALGDTMALAYTVFCTGMLALGRGDVTSAIPSFEEALRRFRLIGDDMGVVEVLIRLCVAHCLTGDESLATSIGEEARAICETRGEHWRKAYVLVVLGAATCRQGDTRRAAELVSEALRINRSLDDPRGVGVDLEVLAWIAVTEGRFQRAARLYGILRSVWEKVGEPPLSGYAYPATYREDSESRTSRAIGEHLFGLELRRGARLDYDDALAYALEEQSSGAVPRAEPDRLTPLTRKETQVARMIRKGMSNKEIATALVIAQRTAESHVEHILGKLGLTSRTQIAIWVGENERAGEHGAG